ncbi:MAG: NAD(P)H-hydrate epimerase, partial [Burkholderiales bacterium]
MPPTPVFLTEHIRAIEAWACGLPDPPPLMERAGLAAAQLTQRVVGEQSRKILVLAGPGNNGGDALVAARHLKDAWFDVRVVFTGDAGKLMPDAKAALDAWQQSGGGLSPEIPVDFSWDLALDGLFGIGLERDLDLRHAQLVAALNVSPKPVIAIDIPSGLHADSGRVLGGAVHAAHTITFIGYKAGLFTRDGPDHAGEVVLETLGVQGAPPPAGHGFLIDREIIANVL